MVERAVKHGRRSSGGSAERVKFTHGKIWVIVKQGGERRVRGPGMSRIERDPEADTAYVYVAAAIGNGEAVHQTRVKPPNPDAEIVLDFDAQGMLLGVEILGASRVLRPDPPGGQE